MSRLSPLERAALLAVCVLTAAAGAANYGHWPPVPRFLLATLALAGLAWTVSLATEQLGERFGPGVTGMLHSTLGNLPELFVVVFALQKHELIVAQTAIVGSLFANAMLVLGLVIVVGARRSADGVMRFSHRLPRDTTTLLLVTVFIIVLLGLLLGSHDRASHHVEAISVVGAVSLLVVYFAWAVPYLRSDAARGLARPPQVTAPSKAAPRAAHPRPLGATSDVTPRPAHPQPTSAASAPRRASAPAPFPSEPALEQVDSPRLSLRATLALLAASGAASGFVSDWFVGALAPAIHELRLSQAFAGLVIVAIAGNAVENATGLVLAWKGRSDLAISVVKNSVAQIAAFLFPALVLISFALATTLTFSLAPVYVGALALMALVVWQVTADGEAAEFEGWALVALYVILATLTLYE